MAGLPIEPPFPVERLRDIAMALPTKTPGQQKQRGLLESSINHLNWDGVKNALMAYGGFTPTGNTNFAPFPDSGPAPLAREPLLREPLLAPSPVSAPALTTDFFGQIARLIEYAMPALGHDDDRFQEQTHALIKALRSPESDAVAVKQMIANYGHRLSFVAEDQAEIKKTLLKLLHLVFAAHHSAPPGRS